MESSRAIIPQQSSRADTRRIAIESPLALFAPEHLLEAPLPAPLYLLEYVPGSLKRTYETGPDGRLLSPDDSNISRVVTQEDGRRISIEIQGSQTLGLPTQRDVDFILAILRIADEGGADEDGTIRNPSYHALVRASGYSNRPSRKQVIAAKTAVDRWSAVTVKASTEISFLEIANQIRLEGGYPLAPDGYPDSIEKAARHYILRYERTTERRREEAYDHINLLQINPIWLNQASSGVSAWIDVDTHAQLSSLIARRMYQIFAIRIARGLRTPFLWDLQSFETEIGYQNPGKPNKRIRNLSVGLQQLVDAEVLSQFEFRPFAWGDYELEVDAGPKLLSAARLRGVGGADPLQTRALLWHLQRNGIPVPRARELLRSHAAQARKVLQRALYVQTELNGRVDGKPVASWGGWIISGTEQGWQFAEPAYLAWLDNMTDVALHGFRALQPRISARTESNELAAPAAKTHQAPSSPVALAPLPTPDTLWGRVAARFAENRGSAQVFWLRGTRSLSEDGGAIDVAVPEPFGVDRLNRWRVELEQLAETLSGEPTTLRFVHHAEASS